MRSVRSKLLITLVLATLVLSALCTAAYAEKTTYSADGDQTLTGDKRGATGYSGEPDSNHTLQPPSSARATAPESGLGAGGSAPSNATDWIRMARWIWVVLLAEELR